MSECVCARCKQGFGQGFKKNRVRTFNNKVGEERKQASKRRGEDEEKQGWMTEVGWGEERRPITRTIESLQNGVSVCA